MILVTGSAGFLGSNLCHYLVNKGYPVIGLDKLSTVSNRDWTLELESNHKNRMIFKELDLCNQHHVKRLFENYPIKKIVHLAAESHVDRSIDSAGVFWDSNVKGTFNLLNIAKEFNIELIINQITDEFYGEKPNDSEALEGHSPAPTSPYPCSKTAQYFVGKSFINTFDLPIISTFPVNCYGPRQYHEKIIPKFTYKLLVENQPVPLMKSTHFERDWLPVDDFCLAIEIILNKGKAKEDYNIGADNHRSNQQLTEEILSICKKDPNKYIEIVPDRKAHDCRYAVNCDKLKKLGWYVQNDFTDYLKYTINWYKKYFTNI